MTDVRDQAATLERVLLAEYDALKREQVDRIGRRDQLMNANLTAVVGVLAAVLIHAGPVGLLLLPPVCLVLGWTYTRIDRHVAHIKAYMRDDLGPRLGALAGGPVLRWENGPRRRRRTQVAVEFATFVVPAVAALAGYVTAGRATPLLVAVGGAELAATVLFAVALVRSGNDEPGAGRG